MPVTPCLAGLVESIPLTFANAAGDPVDPNFGDGYDIIGILTPPTGCASPTGPLNYSYNGAASTTTTASYPIVTWPQPQTLPVSASTGFAQGMYVEVTDGTNVCHYLIAAIGSETLTVTPVVLPGDTTTGTMGDSATVTQVSAGGEAILPITKTSVGVYAAMVQIGQPADPTAVGYWGFEAWTTDPSLENPVDTAWNCQSPEEWAASH